MKKHPSPHRTASRLRLAAVASSAVLLAGTALAGSAQAAPEGKPAAERGIKACGYYETQTDAYYGHCGTTWVKIQVDIDWWPTDIKRCVPPGETHLGTTDEIDNAWAIEGTCG
ncbi:hypothetical protein RKD19_005489 [Streptomyces canus]|uniref:DUF6355 family natural product biosynthesis protein n=1 Tax=unclassified Streptomyces TaxID=2593676 RepID=UPI000F648998|nr:DUF6355 family natural product biosynthesis protein [Streptomyces sp. RP5T]RRR84892.1 hypothetical protein EHS43_10055 [Streptomyces sp. RP5T]